MEKKEWIKLERRELRSRRRADLEMKITMALCVWIIAMGGVFLFWAVDLVMAWMWKGG